MFLLQYIPSTVGGHMKRNKFVCVYMARPKVKKKIPMVFYFLIQCRKNMVLAAEFFKHNKNKKIEKNTGKSQIIILLKI